MSSFLCNWRLSEYKIMKNSVHWLVVSIQHCNDLQWHVCKCNQHSWKRSVYVLCSLLLLLMCCVWDSPTSTKALHKHCVIIEGLGKITSPSLYLLWLLPLTCFVLWLSLGWVGGGAIDKVFGEANYGKHGPSHKWVISMFSPCFGARVKMLPESRYNFVICWRG